MSPKKESNTLLDTVTEKISELITDFQNDNVSREQFNLIYSRYNIQLNLALSFLANSGMTSSDALATNAIAKKNYKAKGCAIYYRESSKLIETLGDFSLDASATITLLDKIKDGEEQAIYPHDDDWFVSLVGKHTIVVLLYAKEPNASYFNSLDYMMTHFESANQHLLAKDTVDIQQLAQPFISIIKTPKK